MTTLGSSLPNIKGISSHLWYSIFIFANGFSYASSSKHINILAWIWSRSTYWNQLALLRLPCTFRSIIFFKSGFLSQNIGRSVIFNFFKKNYRKRLNFGGEITVSRLRRMKKSTPWLIALWCYAINREDFRGRTGYSFDQLSATTQASSLV